MRLPAVLVALCMACSDAGAAVLETDVTPEMAEMGCTARLSGVIENGDLERIRPFLDRSLVAHIDSPSPDHPLIYRNFAPAVDYGPMAFFSHRLCLDSPGGSLTEALRIVDYIRKESADGNGGPSGIQTAIARGDRCESACAYVFLAGRFVRFSGTAAYEGRSNQLLHPLGRLGLHAPFLRFDSDRYSRAQVQEIWKIGMDATSLISRQIANGNIFMSSDLFSEMVTYLPSEMLVLDTVGQAVRWGIEVEPNSLTYGEYPFSRGDFESAICMNAAEIAPSYVDLVPLQDSPALQRDGDVIRSSGAFSDSLSGRRYECEFPANAWEEFQADLGYFEYYGISVRQGLSCSAPTVKLTVSGECYDCTIEVDLPCIGIYPNAAPINAIHMDPPQP